MVSNFLFIYLFSSRLKCHNLCTLKKAIGLQTVASVYFHHFYFAFELDTPPHIVIKIDSVLTIYLVIIVFVFTFLLDVPQLTDSVKGCDRSDPLKF